MHCDRTGLGSIHLNGLSIGTEVKDDSAIWGTRCFWNQRLWKEILNISDRERGREARDGKGLSY